MKLGKMKLLFLSALLIAGCSAKSVVDEEGAKKLNADATVQDFLLNEKYYKLPCPVTTFIENGWKIEKTEETDEDPKDIILTKGSMIELRASHKDYDGTYLRLETYNDTEADTELLGKDALVQVAVIDIIEGKQAPVVVKGGITEQTSEKSSEEIILKLNEKTHPKHTEDDADLSTSELETEDYKKLLSVYFGDGKLESITVGDDSRNTEYKEYESKETQAEEIKNTKSVVENASKLWEEKYEAIVSTLKADPLSEKIGIHKSLTILADATTETSLSGFSADELQLPSDPVFIVEDSAGNLYALKKEKQDNKDFIGWPALNIGETIDVWAYTVEVLFVDEEKNESIPLIEAKIIEKNGEIIYRADY